MKCNDTFCNPISTSWWTNLRYKNYMYGFYLEQRTRLQKLILDDASGWRTLPSYKSVAYYILHVICCNWSEPVWCHVIMLVNRVMGEITWSYCFFLHVPWIVIYVNASLTNVSLMLTLLIVLCLHVYRVIFSTVFPI